MSLCCRLTTARQLLVLLLGLFLTALVSAPPVAGQFFPDGSSHTLVAGKTIKIDEGGRVIGDVHANLKVALKEDSTLIGDVSAGTEIEEDGDIVGTELEKASEIALLPFDADSLRQMADRTLAGDQVLAALQVDDVLFVDGKVAISGPVTGSGMVLAAGEIVVEAELSDQPGPTLVAVGDVTVENRKGWRGLLVSGSNIELEDKTRLEGRALAHGKITVGEKAVVICSPILPSSDVAKPLVLLDPSSAVYHRYAGLAGNEVEVEKGSYIEGNVHSNNKVQLGKDIRVQGEITALGEFRSASVTKTTGPGKSDPVDLPALPGVARLLGLADRVFEDDVTFSDETVDDVVLVFGNVEIEGVLHGRGTIIASHGIQFKGTPRAADPQARLSLISLDEIKLGPAWTFRGSLWAREDIKLGQSTKVHGIAIALEHLDIQKDVRLSFEDVAAVGE